MLLNCEARKDSWESTGLQWDQISHPKENQLWIFIGRTDAEISILCPPDAKELIPWKRPCDGKDWRKNKGAAEDEIISITNSVDMNFSKFQEIVKDREAWSAAVHGVAMSQTRLSNWTASIIMHMLYLFELLKEQKEKNKVNEACCCWNLTCSK